MLTTAQLATFKAAINAEVDAAFASFRAAENDPAMAAWLNFDHATTMVWRPAVPTADAIAQVVWSEFEAATQAKRDTWFALTSGQSIDATKASVRTGFASALGGASVSAANLTALAQRKATRFENIFTAANVCSLFDAKVTDVDVNQARKS